MELWATATSRSAPPTLTHVIACSPPSPDIVSCGRRVCAGVVSIGCMVALVANYLLPGSDADRHLAHSTGPARRGTGRRAWLERKTAREWQAEWSVP